MKEKIKKVSLMIIGMTALALAFWIGYDTGRKKSLEEFFRDVYVEECNFEGKTESENYCILNTPLGEYYIYDIESKKSFEEFLKEFEQ